jgi:hypothetical protein
MLLTNTFSTVQTISNSSADEHTGGILEQSSGAYEA